MSLEAFSLPGRFWRGNLHTHSTRSDGLFAPEEVCRRYREKGYDFLCLSDHFREVYGYPVTDTSPFRADGFTTLIGAELHAPASHHDDLWHILAVGLPLDFAPPVEGESGPALAARARAAGAFVAIAHPEWSGLSLKDGLSIDAAHAVEVYNHTSARRTSRGGGAYHLDALLDAGRWVNALACDDAHFKSPGEPERDAFGAWVMVKAEANEPEALLAALKAGHYYSTRGPLIEDIRVVDGDLVIRTSPVGHIALLGPGVRAKPVGGPRLVEARFPLAGLSGGWCRLVAIGDDGLYAWSNPLKLADLQAGG